MSLIGTVARDTFDSFNGYILKGDPAQGVELMFDTLMARATDEPDAIYGLVAKSADVADDGKSVTFRLRPEATLCRWHARSPPRMSATVSGCCRRRAMSASGSPSATSKAARCWGRTRCATASRATSTRDLPLTVAQLPIFSKAYYAKVGLHQVDARAAAGLRPLHGEGLQAGRVCGLCAAPRLLGQGPAGEPRAAATSTRSASSISASAPPGFEALKSGILDLREEYTSRDWATAYDFPAKRDGRVVHGGAAGRNAIGRAGLLLQSAAREVPGHPGAPGAEPRLRLRMDRTRICSSGSMTARRASSNSRP